MKRRDFIRNAGLALSTAFIPNIAFPSFLRGGASQAVHYTMALHYPTFGHQEILA